MTIKLLIFDLDGVLIDSCNSHYIAFNKALLEITGITIGHREHLENYNGLNTRSKLKKIGQEFLIDKYTLEKIYDYKQLYTREIFNNIIHDDHIEVYNLLSFFKSKGYIIHCASNCIKDTLKLILTNMGIINLFDYIASNEDTINPKPYPEMYYKCFIEANVSANETLIFEDSMTGLQGSISSGGNVCHIKNVDNLTIENVLYAINYYNDNNDIYILKKTCFMKRLNIVIPMAGDGSRFVKKGYIKPKPLIDTINQNNNNLPMINKNNNIPMITKVIKNIGIDANYIFIVKQDHIDKYYIDSLLKSLIPDCTIIPINKTTEGAACTVLLAEKYMNKDEPLLISNCDQFIEWNNSENNAFEFIKKFLVLDVHLDAVISTFKNQENPLTRKWSYVKLENGVANDIQEKNPISDIASTGLYLCRKASDFIKYSRNMINKNIRVNNEFYVAPVFNEFILDNKKVGISNCYKFWSLGVPEDLELYNSLY